MIPGRQYYDGFSQLQGGVLSGVDPNAVPENFSSRAVNMVFRSGFPETRPSFEDPGIELPERAKVGRFQGAASYNYAGKTYLAFAIQGNVFAYDLEDKKLVRLTEQVPIMDPTAERFFFLDSGRHLIVQDGKNLPTLVQGLTARSSDPQKVSAFTGLKGEIGPGGPMAYAYGQLIMALPKSNQFIVGDPALAGGNEDNYLFDTLNQYTKGAGAFEVGGNREISAVALMPQLDMPEGIGPILVFTPDLVEAFNVTIPRENWGEQVISQRMLSMGAASENSVVLANTDVYFRSADGIRSIKQSRSAEESRVVFTATRGNQFWLEHDAPDLLRFASGVFFDNRVLMTCNPYRIRQADGQQDVAHGGLVSLDLDIERSPRQTASDICDGLWTGMEVTQLVTADTREGRRCFAFVKDVDGMNAIREITTKHTGKDFSGPIRGRLYTQAYGSSEGMAAKRLGSIDLWLSNLSDSVTFAAAWRPDHHPVWLRLGQVMRRGEEAACCRETPSNDTSDSFPRTSFGSTDDRREFFRAEVKIDFVGKLRITGLRLMAEPVAEGRFSPSDLALCRSISKIPDNDYNLGVLA